MHKDRIYNILYKLLIDIFELNMKIIGHTLVLLLLSCTSETPEIKKQRISHQNEIVKQVKEKGRNGDVVLKNGYGFVSRSIVKLMNEEIPISHCGLLIKDSLDDNFYIIHAVAKQVSDRDGVQKISLEKFINDVRPEDFYLIRHKTNSQSTIVNEAICLLNSEIPFDHNYDLKTDDEIYCSEFIYKIFLNTISDEVFTPRTYGTNKLLYFNDLLKHKNFETIIN